MILDFCLDISRWLLREIITFFLSIILSGPTSKIIIRAIA
jgi:hypothetical protein